MHVTDMYPTLLGIAGARLDQPKPIDGIDQWATMTGARLSPRKDLLLSMEDFRGALMTDDWKLIVHSRLPVRYELYNVQDDPSEEDNRAEREPQRVQDILVRFNEYAWEMAPSLYLEDLRKPVRPRSRTGCMPAKHAGAPLTSRRINSDKFFSRSGP